MDLGYLHLLSVSLRARSLALAIAIAALGWGGALACATPAAAQAPAINLGSSLEPRFEGNHRDARSGPPIGQTRLVIDTLLDTDTEGPFVVTLEQSGRALASGSCRAQWDMVGAGFLRDCSTEYVDTSDIRTSQPVEVVVAVVNAATDARTELYRGTFPVIAFWDWTGTYLVERRALRADSLYGVGYVRQDEGNVLQFTYVTTHDGTVSLGDDVSLRCRVGTGEWTGYETTRTVGQMVRVRNVSADGNVHGAGQEIVTEWIRFRSRMPIAVPGRDRGPDVGTSLDGAWTCEFRTGGAGARVVQRELRFDVLNGFIQPHAIESQIPAGRGSALTSIALTSAATPMILDPAIVRGTVAGRRLAGGATAPVVAGMPARATQPALTVARRPGRR